MVLYLLQGVAGAELVDFVVNFVEDPELVVAGSILPHDRNQRIFAQLIHHLDRVERHHHPATSAARDVRYPVSLHTTTYTQTANTHKCMDGVSIDIITHDYVRLCLYCVRLVHVENTRYENMTTCRYDGGAAPEAISAPVRIW